MREKRIKNGFTYTFLAIGGVAMLFPVIWMFLPVLRQTMKFLEVCAFCQRDG